MIINTLLMIPCSCEFLCPWKINDYGYTSYEGTTGQLSSSPFYLLVSSVRETRDRPGLWCWTGVMGGWAVLDKLMTYVSQNHRGWRVTIYKEWEQTFRPALYKTDTTNPHLAMSGLLSSLHCKKRQIFHGIHPFTIRDQSLYLKGRIDPL